MEIFLLVVFFGAHGPDVSEGWHPTEHPNMEVCLTRKEFMESYLETIEGIPDYVIQCGEMDSLREIYKNLFSTDV